MPQVEEWQRVRAASCGTGWAIKGKNVKEAHSRRLCAFLAGVEHVSNPSERSTGYHASIVESCNMPAYTANFVPGTARQEGIL